MPVLGLVLQSINLAVTISKLRAPGLAWRRLPAFTFSGAVSSWTMIVAGSAMLAALVMLEMDRHFGGVFFDPGEGGAPLYYQHLSWIFFTGCYLVFLLPAFGAISEILPVFSGKPLLSRGALLGSMAAIMPLGLLAWMQNMMSALDPDRLALRRDADGAPAGDPDRGDLRQLARHASPAACCGCARRWSSRWQRSRP